MKTAVICTGNELLRGTTINTNLACLGQKLTAVGLEVELALTVGDELQALENAISQAAEQADLILLTGGLGSTCDDLSRDAVAAFCRKKLEKAPELVEKLTQYWHIRHAGEEMPDFFLRQAEVPEGAELLPNPNGSAPGLWLETSIEGKTKFFALLPGPPAEFSAVCDSLLPKLQGGGNGTKTRSFAVAGAPEVEIQQLLTPLLRGKDVSLALCASEEGTRVFFTGTDGALLEELREQAKQLFGRNVLLQNGLELIADVLQHIRSAKLTLGTAESCTGGRIAGAITEYAGVSDLFKGGVVSYSNEAKERLLGVDRAILDRFGAVSKECAEAMVHGACRVLDVDCAIAVTGIAGPGGATADKPVGLVFLAAEVCGRTLVKECRFRGDRNQVRVKTQAAVLLLLRTLLLDIIRPAVN